MVIARKSWPRFFERIKDGTKTIDVRIADLPMRKQFPMVLEEWDPKRNEYTGRRLRVTAKVIALADILSFYTLRELMTHQLVVLEYSAPKKGKKKRK